MAEKPGKDNTTMNEIADVLLIPIRCRENAFSNEAQFRNEQQISSRRRGSSSGRHREIWCISRVDSEIPPIDQTGLASCCQPCYFGVRVQQAESHLS